MEALILCYRGEPLREFPFDSRPVEVGRGRYCDIVVHDAGVAERELLLRRSGGSVVAYDLKEGGRLGKPRPVPPNEPMPLGRYHALVRIAGGGPAGPARPSGGTEELALQTGAPARLAVLVGSGAEARRSPLSERPFTVGSGPRNDLVLSDRAVSAFHCRFEPFEGDVLVRDLGSRNGTWVGGVRVDVARIGPGARVRVGRTDLTLAQRTSPSAEHPAGLIARSPAMVELLSEVERFADLSWPVLVQGESGSGKEGVARALHDRSRRRSKPFVALNAGGLPRELIESELFGHERGAFTGATGAHRGVFEQAHGGTLFLDEIGELPLSMQARLLRVLEAWEVRRVGSESTIPVDVRLVCATHRDLRAMVTDGAFRHDLYYRVTRLAVVVPPMRERPEDVRALAEHFLARFAEELGPRALSKEASARLLAHPWPGNVRELRNVLGAAAAATPSEILEARDVDEALARIGGPAFGSAATSTGLRQLLIQHGGNIAAAARALGVPRSTLRDRLRREVGSKGGGGGGRA